MDNFFFFWESSLMLKQIPFWGSDVLIRFRHIFDPNRFQTKQMERKIWWWLVHVIKLHERDWPFKLPFAYTKIESFACAMTHLPSLEPLDIKRNSPYVNDEETNTWKEWFTLSPVLINEKQLHAGVKGSSLGLKSLKIQDFKLKSSSTICVE